MRANEVSKCFVTFAVVLLGPSSTHNVLVLGDVLVAVDEHHAVADYRSAGLAIEEIRALP
jgi:hypothetical protein